MSALAPNWSLIVFVVGVVVLCVFMLTVPLLLGGRTWGRDKHKPFESGVVGVGGARMRFSAKFYLVAIFFVLFDIEALFLYAWSVSVKESGWAGFVEVTIFIAVLMVGLVYIWRVGALNWSPNDLRTLNKNRLHVGNNSISLAEATAFIPMEILELDPTGKVPAQQSGKLNAAKLSADHADATRVASGV